MASVQKILRRLEALEEKTEELEFLKQENFTLRKDLSATKKELSCALRDISTLKQDNAALKSKVKRQECSTKKSLSTMGARVDGLEKTVHHLKGLQRVLSMTVVDRQRDVAVVQRVDQIEADVRVLKGGSGHPTPPSSTATPAASNSSSGGATGGSNIVSPLGATGSVSPPVSGGYVTSSPGQTARQTLSPEEFQREEERSVFNVRTRTPRRLQHTAPTVIDGYDIVMYDSDCMNRRTGVYTTPVTGKYRFVGGIPVSGTDGTCGVYLCGSDGRREKMVERDLDVGPVGRLVNRLVGEIMHKDEYWRCDQGVRVWVEAQASRPGVGLQVRFGGTLVDD